MAIGLYRDIAVGSDSNGADAWMMRDLYAQVETLKKSGASLEQMKSQLHMEKYKDFRKKYERLAVEAATAWSATCWICRASRPAA